MQIPDIRNATEHADLLRTLYQEFSLLPVAQRAATSEVLAGYSLLKPSYPFLDRVDDTVVLLAGQLLQQIRNAENELIRRVLDFVTKSYSIFDASEFIRDYNDFYRLNGRPNVKGRFCAPKIYDTFNCCLRHQLFKIVHQYFTYYESDYEEIYGITEKNKTISLGNIAWYQELSRILNQDPVTFS